MTEEIKRKIPPPVLACSKLIAYALNDEDVVYTGRQLLFIGRPGHMKQLGEMAGIVIMQPYNELSEYLAGFCDENWNVKAVTAYKTIEIAKEKTERYYAGITQKWIDHPYSEEEIRKYIEDDGVDPDSTWWE